MGSTERKRRRRATSSCSVQISVRQVQMPPEHLPVYMAGMQAVLELMHELKDSGLAAGTWPVACESVQPAVTADDSK